jgi:Cu(I)/Ag(I) efflux system protein CusF
MIKQSAIAALTLVLGLAACDPAAEDQAEKSADAMADMEMSTPTEGQTVQGVGAVIAVDAEAGTITLNHEPIPEAGWPAMTMMFKAAPEVTEAAEVGERVAFEVRLDGQAGEVTAIREP